MGSLCTTMKTLQPKINYFKKSLGYRTLPSPSYFMKALFTAVPFIYYIMSTFQEKMTRHNKKKKKKQKNTA